MHYLKRSIRSLFNAAGLEIHRRPAPQVLAPAPSVPPESSREQQNQATVNSLLSGSHPIQLELGAGARTRLEGWTTVDMYTPCDLVLDITKRFPFPDESVDRIYSSHVLEHMNYGHQTIPMLAECLRILKPGGSFSVAVPDASIFIQGYLDGKTFDVEKFCTYPASLNYRARINLINYIAYMDGEHKHMFDLESLLTTLQDAGFRNARPRPFDPFLDLEVRHHETIYAIAEK
jgi:predicted SAM-dependent methyltransferase